MRLKTRLAAAVGAVTLSLAISGGSTLAHYCFNPDKQPGAGSVGVYNLATGAFTPGKRYLQYRDGFPVSGGFVTFTDGMTFQYDLYLHQTLPEGALASGPGGDDHCDGRGVDDALACLGFGH